MNSTFTNSSWIRTRNLSDARAEVPEVLPWYAVRVRSNHENAVFDTLCRKGYQAYLPLHRKSNMSGCVENADRSLFPGYIFARIDVKRCLPLFMTPGVVGLVGVGRSFMTIPAYEIEAIQTVVRSEFPCRPWPFLREGNCIRIHQGVLEGLEGFLVEERSEYRVVISVELLQRSVAVEIAREWIQPLTCEAGY